MRMKVTSKSHQTKMWSCQGVKGRRILATRILTWVRKKVMTATSRWHPRTNTSQITSLLLPCRTRNQKTTCDRLEQRTEHDPLVENGNPCRHAQKTWSLGGYQSLAPA